MATTDRGPVEAARNDFSAARSSLVDALFAFEQATNALREASRTFAPGTTDLNAAQAAQAAANASFQQARALEASKYQALQAALASWLPDTVLEEEDTSRLEASSPIVLLPVRLETRFDGNFLKLRIFPDEISLNTHERALTIPERDAAKNYYDQLNKGTAEKSLWRDISARFGAPRAAYILRQMLPVFGVEGLHQSSSYSLSSSFCGGSLVGGRNEELFFPTDIQLRSSSWTRPGEAILPDRWSVTLYSGATSRTVHGKLIPEPLAMTGDPKLQESDLVAFSGTYKIDDKIRWTVDFQRAVDVGMALEIPLSATEATQGFDRIIVIGLKSSIAASDTSRLLEKLIDAQHYTRGMAIVPQGTATNNMKDKPTGYPVKDNAGEFSFGIERQNAPLDREFSHHCLPFGTDGWALSMALGVPSGVFSNIDRAYKFEIDHARSMNEAVWPATIGYFMQHMMQPIFTAAQIADAKDYFRSFVLGRGSAPAFRIGGTPYGVLPIGALSQWQPHPFGATDARDDRLATLESAMLQPLRRLQEIWLEGVSQVPRIGSGASSPDANVAVVLSTAPSSREFRIRYGFSEAVQWNLWNFFGWSYGEALTTLDQQSQQTFGRLGFPAWRTPIGRTLLMPQQLTWTGTIVAPVLSESAGLPGPNFISNLGNVSALELALGQVPGANGSLLYTVLRHATLMEYARTVSEANLFNWIEYQVFNVPSLLGSVQTVMPQVLSTPLGTLNQLTNSHLTALAWFAGESTAELERLFTETLDLTSYRLDAWIGAFFARRLDDMRRAQVAANLLPKGDFLGGYGWLEEVRPKPHPTKTVPGVGTFETQAINGGLIHTPSMSHAAAAAVLRNGQLSFAAENPSAYAVDLSSSRVRAARELFEGVRNGQPVGALLGYKLERALHEGHPGVSGLDDLRFTLRKKFPLVANKSGLDATDPAEAIAARNVVDGSYLLTAYKNNQLTFGTGGLPAVGSAQYNALISELDNLDRAYDAAADLLLSEGVFQLVRGNIDAAVPTINNVVDGKHPPDSILSRSARGGVGIAHRVALVFPSDASPLLPSGWPTTLTARATAEPALNAWLGQLVGDPRNVSASLTYLDSSGNVITSTHLESGVPVVLQSVPIQLADLGLQPADLLVLAEVVAQSNQGGMVDRRIIAAGLASADRKPDAPPATYRIDYEVSSGRSFPAVLEVLSAAGVVLRAARPLETKDLLSPAEVNAVTADQDAQPGSNENGLELYNRGQAAFAALSTATAVLAAAVGVGMGVREALIGAAQFAPLSAFPDPTQPDSALLDSANAVVKDLSGRQANVPAPFDATNLPLPADRTAEELLAHGKATLAAVFGTSFVALPHLALPRFPELQLSLDARSTLLGSDDSAPDRYLTQITRSRARLGRWRKLNLYARTSGLARPGVDVVQLPYIPGEKWLGLPFDPNTPPDEGRVALLLLNYASSLNPSVPWTGLVLDDWSEIIPKAVETTGIAFHFDSPQAEAPQAVLVAVPSTSSAQWTFAELLASLEQTVNLMKIRTVSQEYLDVGQLFPMTITPSNILLTDTVATIFGALGRSIDFLGLV
ncbi:MAG TPA: hypothetical protein VFK05_24620 [Polyangiaceae bacterium]|nr:hypothetical protein [Polyangiaceae bacterium]